MGMVGKCTVQLQTRWRRKDSINRRRLRCTVLRCLRSYTAWTVATTTAGTTISALTSHPPPSPKTFTHNPSTAMSPSPNLSSDPAHQHRRNRSSLSSNCRWNYDKRS